MYIKFLSIALVVSFLSSCDQLEKEAVIIWQNGDHTWSSYQPNITLHDGFFIIYAEEQNKFGVRNQINFRINGTDPGMYTMHKDMFGSVAFMESIYYSYNAYLPDTTSRDQFFRITALDKQHKKISAEFEFIVFNGATGKSETVKGTINNATFKIDLTVQNSIIEISANGVFLGTLKEYDGFNFKYAGHDPLINVSFAFQTTAGPGIYDVTTIPVFLYSNYTSPLHAGQYSFSGKIQILEKKNTSDYIKGMYDIILRHSSGNKRTLKGFFTANRK
jgi:hypothetical protein